MLEHQISESDFKEGRSSLIFGKLAKKDRRELNEELAIPHGPLAKNQATFDFEYIVKQCLQNDNEVTFTQDTPEGDITCKIAGKSYNVTKIIKEMDARLLQFNLQDKKAYVHGMNNRRILSHSFCNLDIEEARRYDTERHLEELTPFVYTLSIHRHVSMNRWYRSCQ